MPGAVGDPLLRLRHGISLPGLEQEEVAVLVDRLAAEPEVPVDHLDRAAQHQVAEPRLLRHLAASGLSGRLTRLEMALREAPVLVRVPDEQEPHHCFRAAPEHHPAGAGLALGPPLTPLHHPAAPPRSAECGMRNVESQWRFAPRADLPRTFRIPPSAFRICFRTR